MEPEFIPPLLLIGIIAGFFNTLAGGGSVITLPLLIFLGLPPSVANGTNRLALFFQMGSAVYAFKRKGIADFKLALWLSAFATLGAYVGAKLAIDISAVAFTRILACVMFLVLGFILFKPRSRVAGQKSQALLNGDLRWDASGLPRQSPIRRTKAGRKGRLIVQALLFFLMGIYGGFIQAGIGFVMILLLRNTTGYDLLRVNALKALIIFIYTTIALATFILNDKVNWPAGITLAIGTAAGAWVGVHVGITMGEKWIKIIFALAITAFAVKLILS